MGRCKIWAHCNHSFDVILSHDQYPFFLHPDFLSRTIVSGSYSGCWLEGRQATLLVLTTLLGLLHTTNLCTVIL